MKATCFHAVAVMVVLALAQMPALAQPDMGTAFTYQGQLKEAGVPVDDPVNFVFELWDAQTGGTSLGTEIRNNEPVFNGLFTVVLDFGVDPWTANQARWLEITVDTGSGPVTLTPRQELTPTPFSLATRGINVDALGQVGIDVEDPTEQLDVQGNIHASGKILASAYASNSPFIMEAPVGTERARIDDITANFGIGTTDPQRKLHVAGDLSRFRLSDSVGTKYIELAVYPHVVGLTAPTRDLYIESWGEAGNNRVIINPWGGQGNVGIGWTSPDVKLHVMGGSDVTPTGGGFLQTGPSSTENLAFDGNEIMARDNGETSSLYVNHQGGDVAFCAVGDGNVGIGTSFPHQRLEVRTSLEHNAIAGFADKPGYGAVYGETNAPVDQEVAAWGVQGKHVLGDCKGYLGYENGIYVPDSLNAFGRFGVYGKSERTDAYGGYFEGPGIGLEVFGADNDGAIAALRIRSSYGGQTMLLDGNEIDAVRGRLHLNHNSRFAVVVPVIEITGADLAEKFPVSEEVKPGMVVAIDLDHPGQLCLARGAYNRRVAGVVSGANDLPTGAILGNLPGNEKAPPIALSGRVWTWCDASSGSIQPGDLLTTSDTPGHAMRVTDYTKAQDAVIGKAMSSLDEGQGLVLALVSLQ